MFTVFTLVGAECRRRELLRSGLNGPRRRYANRTVRHESLRLAKHTIIVALVIATAMNVQPILVYRNIGMALVCGLLGMNSVLDLIDRRAGLRGYLKRVKKPIA